MEKSSIGQFEAYTDGSAHYKTGIGGSGYLVLQGGEIVHQASKGFTQTTNNRMELLAVISAVNYIPKGARIRVFTDSQYAIKVLTRPPSAKKKNLDLLFRFKEVSEGKKVSFVWVKGHNGNKYNEMADKLANGAYNEMTESLTKNQ